MDIESANSGIRLLKDPQGKAPDPHSRLREKSFNMVWESRKRGV